MSVTVASSKRLTELRAADAEIDGNIIVGGTVDGVDIASRNTDLTTAESNISTNTTNIAAKANIASPTFTGAPLSTTPSTSDNTTKIATTAYVKAQGYITSTGTETNDLTSAVTWTNVPNANITQGSVTQHQAALSITESQISDLGTYSTATGVENNADVTDATNVENAGALMDTELTNIAAVKAINQSLVTTADVTFDNLTVSGITYGAYHSVVEDQYYFDDYNGSKNLSMFYKNSRSDLIRYQAVDNFEYWNGSAWVADASQESNVEKLLDGRQDTSWSVPSTYYKFRFTTKQTSGWPTMAMVWMQTSWAGSTYPGATMLVEEYDGSSWATKVTAEFTSGNGNTNWGLHSRADTALHTGNGDGANETRITIDFYGWSPSNSSYTTIPLQNLMITSNYAGSENTDYTNLFNHARNLTIPAGITLDGNTISGINDSNEFTDDDAHIMTSAAVNDRIQASIIANTDTQDLSQSGNTVSLVDGGSVDISTTTAVAANTAKTGITSGQASAITANTAKTSMTLGTTSVTALAGDTSIPSISGLATLASPTLTGTPLAPTAAANTNTTQIATTAYVQTELTDLIGGAPGTLDTLNELAEAINDDASYASTLTTALATKLPLAGGTMTGTLTMNGQQISSTGIITGGEFRLGTLGDAITFYGGGQLQHSIMARDASGTASDDLRINSYGAVYINLDSNENNTSTADFVIGNHGQGTGTINTLFTLSGEDGDASFSGNLTIPEYIYHSGDTSNYHRFLSSRQTFVVGNAQCINLNNGVSTFGASGGATTLQGSSLAFTGAATFNSTIGSGAITSTGKIQGTELEGTSLDINGDADISGETTFKPKHYGASDDVNSDTRTVFSSHQTNGTTSNRPINYSSIYTLGGSTSNALQISTNEDYSESGMWIRQYNQNNSSPQGTGWQNWTEVWTTNKISAITDAISTTSSTVVASATAVKSAYDRGSTGITNAATAQTTADAALPESDVDADIKTLSLPANTTISAFGKTLIDDAAATNARTTLGLGSAAQSATGDFATAAQGALADSALQSFTETSHADVLVDGDFTSNGLMKRTAAGTYAIDSNTYSTATGVANNATANSSDATLKARANHTGTQAASTISDFDTEVANNSAVTANTAKTSNIVQTTVTGNAGTVTNGVYTNTAQTISGNKTFSGNTVVGTISPTEIAYRATITSDHNFNGTTLSGDSLGTAQGTSVSQGHLVYLSTAGRWEKTDSDALATSFGMLAIQGGDDQTAQLVVNGLYNLGYDPGGSRGDPLYISGTVGLITSTAPTGTGDIVRIVGYKMHATSGLIYFNPDQTWVELA